MTEAEFLARWCVERDAYRAWGNFVRATIEGGLRSADQSVDLRVFLKMPVEPRLKEEDSLIGKAFHRGKRYRDPYKEIEDKVGLRFVVLLTADIRRISDIIEASPTWRWSLDKDFEAERDLRPMEFAYQSKHYVLTAAEDVEFEGVRIPAGTPSEVQIRTLLQHAHSELTHDNIYKREPGTEVTKKVERTVAKSMALIEAADDFFEQVIRDLEQASETERSALSELTRFFVNEVGVSPHVDKSNAIVLQAFKDELGPTLGVRLVSMFEKFPFIGERIRDRYSRQYTFRQPWIVLAYLLVSLKPNVVKERWPLTLQEIEPVFTDLGKALA